MRFTLIYDGPLPAENDHDKRTTEKDVIRRAIHPQLKEQWESSPYLSRDIAAWRRQPRENRRTFEDGGAGVTLPIAFTTRPRSLTLVHSFERDPFTFVPLVTDRHHLLCELDILFLRAEKPGQLFTANTAGDLDNRLKVLFDALQVPNLNQLPKTARPEASEEPLFCLLENDRLVTALRVESERLLDVPPTSTRVRLVIRATIKTSMLTLVNMNVVGGG